jgi:hypothetical protein
LLIARFQKIKQGWNRLWFAPISAYPISAFRILFGIFLFIFLLPSLPHVDMLYSNQGVYSPIIIPDIAPSPAVAMCLYVFMLILCVAFILGYRTRVVTPALTALFLYHFMLSMMVKACSYERIIIVFLFLMSLGDVSRAWSLDARRAADKEPPVVPAWPTRLMILHLSVFYFTAGLYKVTSYDWQHGTVLRNVITSVWATPAGFWLANLGLPDWFFCLASYVLIFFELTCGLAFLITDFDLELGTARRTIHLRFGNLQTIYFCFGVFFHLSVWLFMDLPQFLICPLAYVLYVNGDDLKTFVERLVHKFGTFRGLSVSSPG